MAKFESKAEWWEWADRYASETFAYIKTRKSRYELRRYMLETWVNSSVILDVMPKSATRNDIENLVARTIKQSDKQTKENLMACDICGRNDKPLETLIEGYQSRTVKQICPDCLSDLNKTLNNMRDVLSNQLKKFVRMYSRREQLRNKTRRLTKTKLKEE